MPFPFNETETTFTEVYSGFSKLQTMYLNEILYKCCKINLIVPTLPINMTWASSFLFNVEPIYISFLRYPKIIAELAC